MFVILGGFTGFDVTAQMSVGVNLGLRTREEERVSRLENKRSLASGCFNFSEAELNRDNSSGEIKLLTLVGVSIFNIVCPRLVSFKIFLIKQENGMRNET